MQTPDSPTSDPTMMALADAQQHLAISDHDRRRFTIDGHWYAGFQRLVEWSDVDAFAHANHTAFLMWFEAARNLYLEAVGLPRHSPTTPGPVMKELSVQYRRPLSYHDPVFITARTLSIRRTSLVMDYAAWTSEGRAATCEAVLVLMINATGEKVPIPEAVREALRALDAPQEQ